jgi:hypothetical protein
MPDQSAWRFCQKCTVMFFDGRPDKGHCPAGGGHSAAGFMFFLPHDVGEAANAQSAWRFCQKCTGMFFDGRPDKGHCPAGGGHSAAGFMFVLPHDLDKIPPPQNDTVNFDSGPLTSGLPLGGSAHLLMRRDGNFTFTCHAHDSGFDNIDYTVGAVFMTTSGVAWTFGHQGHVEGTVAGLPFGTPNRNDDFIGGGANPSITNEFENVAGGRFVAQIDGTAKLVGGITDFLGSVVKTAAQELGKAGAAAVIALL